MGMLRDFKVVQVDMQHNPMSVKDFYKNHVSKSLPCVFRNEFANEKIVQELASHQDQDSNDAYLGGMFQMSHEELVAQLSPDVAKMWNDGGSLAHLKRTYDPMKSPVKYRRMRIDYGWFIKPTQTYTTEINAPYAQFMSDKKNMDSN